MGSGARQHGLMSLPNVRVPECKNEQAADASQPLNGTLEGNRKINGEYNADQTRSAMLLSIPFGGVTQPTQTYPKNKESPLFGNL